MGDERCKIMNINTKIIDTHVHVGGDVLDFKMTEEMVVRLFDYYNVDYVILSNCDCVEADHKQQILPADKQICQVDGLKRVLDFAKKYEGKVGIAPFIKPVTEGLTDELKKMILDNREYIKAIKIHPYHSNISPADERCFPYWKLAEELDVPVVSHTGGCEAASPANLAKAAGIFPNVNFVMVHMGLGTDNSEALDMLGKHDNLYGDTTWVPMKTTVEAIKRYGSHRIVFGTDAPIDGPDTYAVNRAGQPSMYHEYFYELPGLIDREAYECLMWKNAVSLFRLQKYFQ